ncbi:MAG: hypothetical protein ABIH18_09030 [Candidatus Omnitrophota bacterium]
MRQKIFLALTIVSFFSILLNYSPVFGGSAAADYICDNGIQEYNSGKYDEALVTFKKALLVDAENPVAKSYIENIFKKQILSSVNLPLEKTTARKTKPVPRPYLAEKKISPQKQSPKKSIPKTPVKKDYKYSREELINKEIDKFSRQKSKRTEFEETEYRLDELDNAQRVGSRNIYDYDQERLDKEEECLLEIAGVKVRGEVQMRGGWTPHDGYWKRANWDLNEAISQKNTRMLSHDALNNGVNTYDPRIYDRLKVLLDTDKEQGFGFHSNITVDPWSFTGKTANITVSNNFGVDNADVQLKYWSNTGYTLNETVRTNRTGDTFNLPEVKVKDGKVDTFSVVGDIPGGGTFVIPEMKIYRQFQPFREFWFDYKQEDLKVRVFPLAYENQALTFDDPLQLSNKHIWWEDSPWIHRWKPGNRNTANVPVDFTKGYWDNSLSFAVRDSESQRLVGLRGFSFDFALPEGTEFLTSVVAPKDPWQDYGQVDNFLSASRLKQSVMDNLSVGVSATSRWGYNVDEDNQLDARNYVVGADAGYEITNGIKASAELAYSNSKYDMSDSQFETQKRGYAYHFSLLGRYPFESIMNTQYGYDGIQPAEEESFFNKFRLFVCRLDEGFDQPLSSYSNTRDDQFWGRHLHFRQPYTYYAEGSRKPNGGLTTWDDVKPSRIGDGIDVGRDTLGLRVESSLWDKKVNNLFDVRNVHSTEGKFVENVAQDELDLQINDRMLFKALGVYQKMHKTLGGQDPFIFDSISGEFFKNNSIEDGKEVSLKTGSLGLEYSFFDWLSINGIYEYTNDYNVGYANTPQSQLWNRVGQPFTYIENGNVYNEIPARLYDQGCFPLPPYPFYNIYRMGININPLDNLGIALDYTFNEYKNASPISSTMNHIGCEISYSPMEKMAIFLKYTYSRWKDIDQILVGDILGHSNIFAEFMYRMSKDEDFVLQYGEASRDPYQGGILDVGWDPYGGTVRTLDTQHIFRIYYRRKF